MKREREKIMGKLQLLLNLHNFKKMIFSNLYGNRRLDEEASRILAGELLPTLSLLIKIVQILKLNQESIHPFLFHD